MGSCKDAAPEQPDAPNPQCSDGIDNDGDGLIDYPADPGCSSPDDMTEDSFGPPACSNGKDDDGDGLIDYPNDPGCLAPQQDSEDDDCPSGPNCPQCANGIDDDGNGQTDYPADTGCTSASDDDEFTLNTAACGATVTIQEMPTTLMATGMLDTTMGTVTGFTDTCGETPATTYPAAVYDLFLPVAKVVTVSTQGSAADTILDIRKTECTSTDAVIACNDDVTMSNLSSQVTTSLTAGHYLLTVLGRTTGLYRLKITEFAGQGATCFMPTDCGPGLVCRVALGDTATSCQLHVCQDGVDDDGDGKNDYPDDPGCDSPTDDDESDDCPSGPTCPQCGNGIDDDGDGLTDYPADPSCTSASAVSESCITTEGVINLTSASTSGNTSTATNDFEPSCSEETGNPDLMYSLVVPHMATLNIVGTNSNFDEMVIAVLDASCGTDNTEVACVENDETTTVGLTNVPAGGYFIDFDTDFFETGPFTLTISGTVSAGGSCEGSLFQAGVFTCEGSLTCQGTVGSRTCFSACSDGVDNDGDGKTDYPNDPGCVSLADNDETDDCPSGPTCPQCGNGIDDDGDGLIDYPHDPNCISASGASESFCTTDPDYGGPMTSPVTSGNNTTGNQTFLPSCQTFATGNDETFSLTIPVNLQSLHLDTIGSTESDTVLTVHDSTCTTELACDDDDGGGFKSLINMTNVSAGTYAISNAAYQLAEDAPFIINMSGVAVAGAACTDILFTNGVLTCAAGQSCTGGVCQ
ncbi:MAG TPA: hypothetical protein VGM88_34325 [Kofleriaceae bacterium]